MMNEVFFCHFIWIVHVMKLCRILLSKCNVAILVHFSPAFSCVYHSKVQMRRTFVCLQIHNRDQTRTLALERTAQFDVCLDSVLLVCEGESKRCYLAHPVKYEKCLHYPNYPTSSHVFSAIVQKL